ncbi:MAG TPA: hypothetical protein PKD61_21120, partial [Polyangiaceae bacterium]|nr:hypothetical protein [Polyangiaceae bacterium]
LGQSVGGNEGMILDLAQWAGTIVDTDYDRKIWNQLQHQTKSQQNIARNIASTDGQLAALQVAIANLGTELIVGRNRGANIGVTWAIVPVGRNERRITNVGTILAENVRVSDVTNDSGRSGFWLVDDALPRNVGVAEWICAVMERSLADPFQSCIQIQWVENGDPHEATYWIS